MMIVLDTNVVSELRKVHSRKADTKVTQWADSVDANDLYISAITVLEIEMGILQIERRDWKQGEILRAWMDDKVMPEFRGRILPINAAVAQRCARLHVPDPKSERDALIAATALVHSMALATRNESDYAAIPVSVINPWNYCADASDDESSQ